MSGGGDEYRWQAAIVASRSRDEASELYWSKDWNPAGWEEYLAARRLVAKWRTQTLNIPPH